MINEKFAKKYFPGRNPIGLHIGFGTNPGTATDMEVIGVVKDFKYTNLRDEIPEQAFVPYLASRYLGEMTVYLRTTADPNQLMSASVRKSATWIRISCLCYAHHRSANQQLSLHRTP